MLSHLPLMAIPLVLYNLGVIGLFGTDPWDSQLFLITMISGGTWAMTLGDLLLVLALILMFVEIMKSTRTSNASLVDHMLSTGVFIIFLVEFLLVAGAASSIFFLLMLIALLDVLAGFSVSLRAASRDVNLR